MLTSSSHRNICRAGVYLEDAIFPCSREDLLQCAEENCAPDIILDAIEDMSDRWFLGMEDVMHSLEKLALDSIRVTGNVQNYA